MEFFLSALALFVIFLALPGDGGDNPVVVAARREAKRVADEAIRAEQKAAMKAEIEASKTKAKAEREAQIAIRKAEAAAEREADVAAELQKAAAWAAARAVPIAVTPPQDECKPEQIRELEEPIARQHDASVVECNELIEEPHDPSLTVDEIASVRPVDGEELIVELHDPSLTVEEVKVDSVADPEELIVEIHDPSL